MCSIWLLTISFAFISICFSNINLMHQKCPRLDRIIITLKSDRRTTESKKTEYWQYLQGSY
jgi:hypothetical protein